VSITSQPDRTFHYGFHCVAFLDILGQRRILRQLPRLPKQDEQTRKLLKDTAGYVLRLRNHLATTFEEFRKPTPLAENLSSQDQQRILDARGSVHYRGFSDSLIMDISFLGDVEQFGPVIGIYGCFVACCMLHLVALSYKRPIRGGIDVGLGMDITDEEVYGPVLERGHFLESQVADYPRIVLGEELIDYLDEVEKQRVALTNLGFMAPRFASLSKELITIDTDGFPMLDFLGEKMRTLTPVAERQKLFQPAVEYIRDQKQVARSGHDYQHLSRYNRLGAYFEKRAPLWSSVTKETGGKT
jgi:hypothetical protein